MKSRGSIITLILSVLPLVVGFILWLTEINATTKANAASINELRDYQKQVYDELREMNQRLSRIEGKLNQ